MYYPHKKLFFLAVGSVVLACTSVTRDDVVVEVDSDIDTLVYDLIPKEGGASTTLRARMDHYGVPGISVAVLRNGEVGWARGFGVKLVGTDDLVDTATVF